MYFGFLEFLGTSELLVILVVALVLFGPRKLPQLSRSLGKSLAEFKKASQDFKQTWEKEVALEETPHSARVGNAMLPPQDESVNETIERNSILRDDAANQSQSQAIIAESRREEANSSTSQVAETQSAQARKQDWL
ncbi:MAG: hypothetical protein AUG51_23145 [Acidobacteria bacterium 13_1_20CM_3_53_8]|nr:MAG: hypothetical protein AUG51_23145 [Acidobacteria bacterium 13_1_20CM_3_53_8]